MYHNAVPLAAQHTPGVKNTRPDALSRGDERREHGRPPASHLQRQPTAIPGFPGAELWHGLP